MPEADQHAGPVVRRAARLHDDRAGLLLLEERPQLAPPQLAPDLGLSELVHGVDLKDGLGGIQADHGDAHRAWILSADPLDPRSGTLPALRAAHPLWFTGEATPAWRARRRPSRGSRPPGSSPAP